MSKKTVEYTLDPKNLPVWDEEDQKRFDSIRDEDIDYSDIPELDDDFFRKAQLASTFQKSKKRVTIRLDADVIEWLKNQGNGYQTRANMILRAAMEQQRPES